MENSVMTRAEMKELSSSNLKMVMKDKGIDDLTLSEWWGIEKDSVDKIIYGTNLITTDKLYSLYSRTAATPNQILIGYNDSEEKIVKHIIDVKKAEFPGHYELAIPEIIIELFKQIPEAYREEANKRLLQYFAMKIL